MTDLSIHPVYLSARAAIVTPERAIPLTLYATQKWLPRLGPERWCLVILLRSLSVDLQRRNDGTKRVSVSWRQLAEMLDVHEETVASWLKHEPIPNDKPWRRIISSDEKSNNLSLFIPRLRYAYETRNSKTRRIGFLLEVLMEDPVVPEDEIHLKKQIELLQMQQGNLGLDTYRLPQNVNTQNSDLPEISKTSRKQLVSDLHNVNPDEPELLNGANPIQLGLHSPSVNPTYPNLPPNVKQHNVGSAPYVNQLNPPLLGSKSEDSGKNVNELDILIQQIKQTTVRKNLRRNVFDPVIQLTEQLLEDNHSTGMLYKVLNALYPERIDLYVSAVRVAIDVAKTDPLVNRGAVFVRALRDFADVAGVDLGLKQSSGEVLDEKIVYGNPGSRKQFMDESSLTTPSVTEAIWAETQLTLRRQMTQATYDAIIQGTVLLQHSEGQYTVGVRSEMAKEWLENRLYDIVQRALSGIVGGPVRVEYKLVDSVK